MVSFSFGTANSRSADVVFEAVYDIKKVALMSAGRLQQFHGAWIEVEFEVQGSLRSVKGKGSYQSNDPDLGPVLKILVADPLGDFEFLIAESNWDGNVESSELPGCNYRVSLTTRGAV
jgi:hypothetical protein